jgi:hypothetical protein
MSSSAVYSGVESFINNDELTEVTFAEGVTTIGNNAFEGCSSLTAITIPDGVTEIGWYAFVGCSSLTAITIPDSVTLIGYGAFARCSALVAITIPDSVTTISPGAFIKCSSLAAITIPDSVTSIGTWAFKECSTLTRLSLSPDIFIGQDCFSNCTALISAAADQNMPTVEDLLNSRWHRIRERILERVAVLSCLKTPWNDLENPPITLDEDGVVALKGATAREMLPKVMWRVILEFL